MKKHQRPLSIEELKEWDVDRYPELDKPLQDIPADYVFVDDNPENPPPISEGGMEADNAPNTEASIQM